MSWVYILGKGLLAGCLRVAENRLHSVLPLVATIHGFTVTKAGCRWHPLPLRVFRFSCLFGPGFGLGLIFSVGLIQQFHACAWGDLACRFTRLVLDSVLGSCVLA
jgi:hypothetical protein